MVGFRFCWLTNFPSRMYPTLTISIQLLVSTEVVSMSVIVNNAAVNMRVHFMHWRRKWQPTPVSLPGESQGWGSLVSCRLWGRTESGMTEATQQQQQQQCCSPPDSSVYEILQAQILEWVAMPSSRGSSWPRELTTPALQVDFLLLRYGESPGSTHYVGIYFIL